MFVGAVECKKVERQLQKVYKLRKNVALTEQKAKNVIESVCSLLSLNRARIRVCETESWDNTSSYQRICGIGIIVFVISQLNTHTVLHELAHHVCAEERWNACSKQSVMHGDAFCDALEFVYEAHSEVKSQNDAI